jgi:hypothetical protein
LDGHALEIEAESTPFIVTSRLGLVGSNAAFVFRYPDGRPLPSSVSLSHEFSNSGASIFRTRSRPQA